MEADGTWFSVQHAPDGAPKRFEVKAMCAYAGKEERGGKPRRREVFHHAMVGTEAQLWSEGISQMGRSFDLGKLERVHLGGAARRGALTLSGSCRGRRSISTSILSM